MHKNLKQGVYNHFEGTILTFVCEDTE